MCGDASRATDVHIRIATRKSALALWQAEHVAERLRQQEDVDDVVLVPLSTRGDEVLDRSLQKLGGKGLFIKELELAMQAGEADIAVHSMKDVPADIPLGFRIAAVLERASPFDALVTTNGGTLAGLPEGAVIGSSSLRRQAQLLALRPDFTVRPLRGNVNTRLAKLENGEYDAIILACAGLERLGLATRISERIASDTMLPAAGQGVIGIECAAGHPEALADGAFDFVDVDAVHRAGDGALFTANAGRQIKAVKAAVAGLHRNWLLRVFVDLRKRLAFVRIAHHAQGDPHPLEHGRNGRKQVPEPFTHVVCNPIFSYPGGECGSPPTARKSNSASEL
jgi:hydroxymethylbilane synthase